MRLLYRVFFFSIILLSSAVVIHAQSLKDIKAGQLSEAQLKQIADRAEADQYSDGQLKQLATAQGMSPEEAGLLVERVREYRKKKQKSLCPCHTRQTI